MNPEYLSPSDAKRRLKALATARENHKNSSGKVKKRLETVILKYEKHEQELEKRAAMPKYSRITKG